MNEHVVIKLVSGETIIARVLDETKDGVHVLNPLQVRMIPVMTNSDYGETAISSRMCQFTEEKDFFFDSRHMVYCKPLNPKMIPIYDRLINSFEQDSNEPQEDEEDEEQPTFLSKKLH